MAANKTMRQRITLICWLMILPVVLIRVVCTLYPVVNTFYKGFFQINAIRHTNNFVGLNNYIQIFHDYRILDTLSFTLFFAVCSIILITVFGLGLALLLQKEFKGRKLLRSVTLIPWALPLVVAGVAAMWAFTDSYGFVNDMIRRIDAGFQFDWFISKAGAQFAVIMVDVWKNTPFYAIMILAGLQSIPTELYESAQLDGCNSTKAFWHITLPNIAPLMIILTVFFTLWRMTQFDLIYTMTQGGPGSATSLLSYRIYVEAFSNMNFGYASSISVLLCMIMVVVALVGYLVYKKRDFES